MIKPDLRIISYNVRGLNNARKRTAIFKHLKESSCDVAFLQETYSSEMIENKWLQEWGGSGFLVHGSKHSRGVAVLFRKHLDVAVLEKYLDAEGRFIVLKVKINDYQFNLINIYAPNREKEQITFINELKKTLENKEVLISDNNIFSGDWNIVLDLEMDKMGGKNMDSKKGYREKINDLMLQFGLVDIWRLKNEHKQKYTWRQKAPRIHCRLDFFLISQHIIDLTVDSKILPSILSDHSPVSLDLQFLETPELGPGHWKLNVSLLADEIYKTKLKELFLIWEEQYKGMDNHNLKWEIIKYEVRSFSISYSKKKSREKRDAKKKLERQLSLLEQEEYLQIEEIFRKIEATKDELNKLHLEEAQGSIIRSRAKWSEEGEKCTSYFLNLEKHNAIKKNIRKLIHGGKDVTDQKTIIQIIKEYYAQLYSEQKVDLSSSNIFDQPLIPKLTGDEKSLCEGTITQEECSKVIKLLKKNKSPGNDGLPIEFYLEFWNELKQTLTESYNYSFKNGLLTTSQRQAIISLIDKPGKDRSYIENWRPISLLNVDYKIMSKCLTERIKKVLEGLIDHSQTGFVKGRNISDGLRTILDIVEDTDIRQKTGILVTIDFQKAFDSLSWDYLFKTLHTFNFGPDLIKWIKLCYTDISSCITNFKTSSAYFNIKRGVRQGDSLSPYLFIVAVELMSLQIRNNVQIRGLKYNDTEIKILSYADDTTAFLKDISDARRLFDYLKKYEKVSGLMMNQGKTEGLWLGINKNTNFRPLGIKWQSCIKILGIHISYNKEIMLEKNFTEKIRQIKQCLNLWKQRDLTIYGKILLLKTFALSKILYPATVLCMPDPILNDLQSLSYIFLWNGKPHKVKKNVIVQDYENGGCCMVDFNAMFKVKQIKWVKKYLDDNIYLWKYTMQSMIGKENLDIFLKSNFVSPELISPFYKQILQTWLEIKYKRILCAKDVLDQYIWYNNNIKITNNMLWSKEYYCMYYCTVPHSAKCSRAPCFIISYNKT